MLSNALLISIAISRVWWFSSLSFLIVFIRLFNACSHEVPCLKPYCFSLQYLFIVRWCDILLCVVLSNILLNGGRRHICL